MSHTLQEVIDLAVKTAVLKAHPVGSYWITETDDDPNIIFGGGVWERVQGKFLQCSDDTHPAGTDIDAGLPNITADMFPLGISWKNNINSIMGAMGVYYENSSFPQYVSSTTTATNWPISRGVLNASWSNAIYGNSDTVQPPAHVVNVWKRTA